MTAAASIASLLPKTAPSAAGRGMAVTGDEQAGSSFEDVLNEIRVAETDRNTTDKPEDITPQVTASATPVTPPVPPILPVGQTVISAAEATEISASLPATANAAIHAQALGAPRTGQNPNATAPDDATRDDGMFPLDTETLSPAPLAPVAQPATVTQAGLTAAAATPATSANGNETSATAPDSELPTPPPVSMLAPKDDSSSAVKQAPPASDALNTRQATPGASPEATRITDTNPAASQQPMTQGFAVELKSVAAQQAPHAPATPIPLDSLAVTIARKAEQGLNQFEISLSPAELGKLDISLRIADDGRVHAVLRAERHETLDLLRQDARTLENQLRQAGLDVGSSSLSFQLAQGNPNRYRTANPEGGSSNGQSGDAPNRNPEIVTHIATRRQSGIDIHV